MRIQLRVAHVIAMFCIAITGHSQVLINEDFSTATSSTPPTGWTNHDINSSGEVWQFNNPGSRTFNSPISSPAGIFDSDNYGSGPTEDAALESPGFDASSGTIVLSFDHYFYGGAGGGYAVEVYNGSTWDTIISGTSSTSNPQHESLDITPLAGASTSAKVRFHWTGDYSWYWIVDNVKVEALSCVPPSSLGITNKTSSSADIYWTTGGAADWNVEYGPQGFTPGTGTMVNATNDTLTLNGLSANSSYDFYVRDSCGVGNVSSWSGPSSFTTACAAVTTLPWSEGFEGLTAGDLPACFSRTSSAVWSTNDNSVTSYNRAPHSGTGYATARYNANDWLFMPSVTLSAGTAYQFSFWYVSDGLSGWDSVTVGYGNGQSAGAMTGRIGASITNLSSATTYTQFVGTFTPSVNGDYNIGIFVHSNYSPWYLTFDDLMLQVAPSCLAPSALGTKSVTPNTASVYWTTGGASAWNVEYGPAGFIPGSGTMIAATNDTTTLTGLTQLTTYDFYIQDDCGGGTTSSWTGPMSFTTTCGSALSGTYTIDNSVATGGTNYATFGELAYELTNCGISGPVTINVKQGTYNEHVTFDSIPGASSTSTITIQADATNTMPAEITDSITTSSENHIIEFNNVDWVTLDGITVTGRGSSYSRAIEFSGTNSNITVQNCILNAVNAGSTSTNHAVVYDNSSSSNKNTGITITGNEINNGSYGVYLYGVSSSDFETGNVVSDNNIQNFYYYGIRLYYQDGATISGNTIVSGTTSSNSTVYGIYNGYSDNSSVIANKVVVTSSSTLYGIEDYYCNASSGAPNIIANNMISCLGNSGSTYGIYAYNNYYTDIVYNSVNVTAGSTTAGRALYLNSSSSGTYGFINVYNNNLVNTGGGYVAEVSSAAVTLGYLTASNSNNFYGLGATLVKVGSTDYANLSAYQTGASLDLNSISANPIFYAADDLHVSSPSLDGAGQVYAGVTTDIEGDVRDASTPDIGADEFTAPSCVPPYLLGVSNVDSLTADIYWTTGGASNWNVEYGMPGFTLGTGTMVNATNDTLSITGLSPFTDYEFYVRDSCGVGNTSMWAGPFAFKTLASPLILPYYNDFETTIVDFYNDPGNDDPWAIDTLMSSGTTSVQNAYSANAINSLELPNPIDMSLYPNAVLMFDQIAKTEGTYDKCYVQYSTDGGTTWQNIPASNYIGGSSDYSTRVYFHEDSYAQWGTGYETPDNTWWKSETFNLAGLTSGMLMLRFTLDADGSAQRAGWFIDNLSIIVPSCIAPTGAGVTNLTSVSADLYWTTGGAPNWNIEYGPSGFSQGAGTLMAVTSDTVSLSGLTANTAYDFYVQDSCGAGNVSAWIGPISFTTPCAAFIAPFSETFDNAGVPGCWSTYNTYGSTSSNDFWKNTSSSWPAYGAAGVSNNTAGLTSYAMGVDGSSPYGTGDTAITLETPMIDVSALTAPALTFDVFQNNTEITNPGSQTLYIDFYDGSTWHDSIFGYSANNSSWVSIMVDVSGYTISGNIQFRFAVNKLTGLPSPYYSDLLIDNVKVMEKPSCVSPSFLGAYNLTSTGAAIYWTTGGASNWNIEYDTTGFVQGGGNVMAATNDTVTLSGLMPNTTYDFYVQDSCGAGNVSTWIGPFTFTTDCAVATLPFMETMETTSATIGCWSLDANWQTAAAGGYGNSATSFEFPFYNVSSGSYNAYSPQFTATTSGYQLSFDYAYATYGSTYIDSMEIYTSADGGATYSLLVGLDGGPSGVLNTGGIVSGSFTPSASEWATYTLALPIGVNKIMFKAITDYGNNLYLDNISVNMIPVCNPSTNLGATNMTTSTADLYWTTGGASDWTIEYGPTGFTLGTGAYIAATNDTVSLIGLTANTCYDFYVQDSCGIGNISSWAGPYNFCTTMNCTNTAGMDSVATVCAGMIMVNLADFLRMADAGGSWVDMDASGTLTDSIFDASMVTGTGPYHFAYYVSATGCPSDTAMITVNLDQPVDAGMDASDTICDTIAPIDLANYLSSGATAGGTWVDVNGTGALTGSMLNVSMVTNMSSYTFRYVVMSGNSCGDDSATVMLYIDDCNTALPEFTTGNISIYPNPTTGQFYIENTGQLSNMHIDVYGVSGQLVMSYSCTAEPKVSLDLSRFSDGIYTIKVITDNYVEIHRVAKK